jgi:hypothetical protein
MDWFDRELGKSRMGASHEAPRPPGCKGLLITLLIVIVGFLIVAIASGWVHITKVAP